MGIFGDLFGGGDAGDAAQEAAALQQRAYKDTAPYRRLGKRAAGSIDDIYLSGKRPFEAGPGYDFRLGEGERALGRYMGARGLSQSGRAMKEALRYGQGMATDEYDRGLNRLLAMAGMGQTANAQGANALNTAGAYGYQAGQERTSGFRQGINNLASLGGFIWDRF